MQFSIHSTCSAARRRRVIPARTWSFAEMAAWGERFHRPGDRRITLNFALAESNPLDPQVLLQHFQPARSTW